MTTATQITRVNEDNVIEWMAQHGRVGYRNEIIELETRYDEIRAEAGRYGQYCEFTQETLRKIKAEIAEVKAAAWDRFIDWATD